jgi:excisionase family DNA binding protein
VSSTNHSQNHRLFTVPQLAEQLQISIRTVRRLIASEKIKTLRIGRAIRITAASLEAYVTEAAGK